MKTPTVMTLNAARPCRSNLIGLAACLFFHTSAAAADWNSSILHHDASGERLVYHSDEDGNRIMDFSHAGYRNGGVPLPNLPVVKTISPIAGDNTAHIQAAIDYVGAMPADANGHRGALRLNPGTYPVSGQIHLSAGGVVLRGSGRGGNPSVDTIIRPTGTQRRAAVVLGTNIWNGWNNNKPGTLRNITSHFIPAGSRTFEVADSSVYSVGDNIIIRHPATDAWLSAVNYGNTNGDVLWGDDVQLVYNRFITRIVGNTIEVDVPIYHDMDRSLSQPNVRVFTRSSIITECGIENLRIEIETAGSSDEDHADIGVLFRGAEDSWARNVTVMHFSRRGFETQQATRITILNCSAIEPHSPITGGRRYSFSAVDHSNQILFKGCYGDKGRHIFITNGGATTSGVVFTQSTGQRSYTTSESHRRWGSAILWDQIDFINSNTNFVLGIGHNRGSFGTGHGWTGTGLVGWNVTSDARIVVQQPPIGQNFAIACKGEVNNLGPWVFPAGFIQGTGQTPAITSLYEAQLAERLTHGVGPSAPARLEATHRSNSGTRFVALQWIDTAIDETNFVVERSSNGGNSYSVIATLPANSVSYTDTSVSANGSFIYRVKAINENGFSAYTNRLPVNLAATQLPRAVTYQAEDFSGFFDCEPARAPHLGYTGWGFVDMKSQNAWFEWDHIDGGMGGMVPVTIRYASTNDRPCQITVNGSNPVNVTFTSSGSNWSSWGTLTVNLPLSAGMNTIRIRATTSARGPNVDKMQVFATPVIYAAGEVAPGETATQAFDGDPATQWRHYSPRGSWLQRATPVALKAIDYTLTSGHGAQANDPKAWTLLGSNDHGASWTTLDSRSGVTFSSRGEPKTYSIPNSGAYKLYRLNITAVQNLAMADSIQLGELDFSYDSVPALFPDPAAFSEAPHPINENAIHMTAVTGSSAMLNPVEYYFAETSGNPGGSDSGWISSPNYTDTGLTAGVQYTYTVTMRDAPDNVGTPSPPLSATTYRIQNADWSPGSGSDGKWTTDANWPGGVTPLEAEQYLRVRFDGGAAECTLDQPAVVAHMIIGNSTGTLFDNRVTLAPGADLTAGLNPFGGIVWTGVGFNNQGTLTVEKGAVFTTAGHLWVGFNASAIGTLMIDGGTVNVGQQFGLGWDGGTGTVELRSGTLNLSQLNATRSISGESVVNIENGTITINGDFTSTFTAYVSAGKIIAFGGNGNVLIDYDSQNNQTKVTARSSETIVSFDSPPTTIFEGEDLHLKINATDADGIDRVFLFKNGVQLGRSEGTPPYQFGAPGQNDPELQNMAPGVYEFRALARDLLGNEGEATISITVLAAVVRINFQPAGAAVPPGYFADTSQVFGDRGNGFSYGWTEAFNVTRERNSHPDKRFDTLNHTQAQGADRVWEIELPNGDYVVNLTGGDPTHDDSFIEFIAENGTANEVTLVSGNAAGVNFISGSAAVTVSDGRLTIRNGPNAVNNKINFVDIFASSESDPYEVWKSIHGITDDFGDEDNDGIINLLEFAFGGDPRTPGTAKLPRVSVNGNNLVFTLQRHEAVITYVIQRSTDLINWEDYVTVTDVHGEVGGEATVNFPVTEMSDGKLFLRLRVESP